MIDIIIIQIWKKGFSDDKNKPFTCANIFTDIVDIISVFSNSQKQIKGKKLSSSRNRYLLRTTRRAYK